MSARTTKRAYTRVDGVRCYGQHTIPTYADPRVEAAYCMALDASDRAYGRTCYDSDSLDAAADDAFARVWERELAKINNP